MKKINISPLKPLPSIGQPLVVSWEEKISGQKVTMIRKGYHLISLTYEGNELIAEIYSPTSGRAAKTTYLCLCKNFTWKGDTKQPITYEV